MPSHSVTIDPEHSEYIYSTKGEDSFSARVRELLDIGIEVDREDTTYACDHCGETFGNPGAKATHERNCPESA